MISVCIPVFNFDTRPFVRALDEQIRKGKLDVEIILLDDASEDTYRVMLKELQNLPSVNIHLLETNVGRSEIRNRLVKLSQKPYLLFADCDSMVVDQQFLSSYISSIQNGSKVICGGRVYQKERPESSELQLHWLYGSERECRSAALRSREPYRGFMTNNFLIERSVLSELQFDESLSGYGHEDTLFGFELEENKIPIQHIDNPLIHLGIENSGLFISKSKNGIDNLLRIVSRPGIKGKKFQQSIKLLKVYGYLKRLGLRKWFAKRYVKKTKVWEENLMSSSPSLRTFDWYRLGYLCSKEV